MSSIAPLPLLLRPSGRPGPACPDGNGVRLWAGRAGKRGCLVGFSPRLRAAGKGGALGGEEAGDAGGGKDVGNDALRAATEKNQKVLAMQKSLLEQVAKRRSLISSINLEIEEQQSDLAIYSGKEKESEVELDLNSEEPNGAYNRHVSSDYSSQATESSLPDNNTPQATKSQIPDDLSLHFEGRIDSYIDDSEESNAAASIQTEEGDLKTAESKVLTPVYLDDSNTEDAKDENADGVPQERVDTVVVADDASSEEGNADSSPLAGVNVMNVIVVAAECTPWSKTGGLGDVVGALPKALVRRGHRVMVVVPRYGNYAESHEIGVRKYYKVDGQDMEVNYFHAYIDGVDFVFMESPIFRGRENNIYGGERKDIMKRMVLFCKAAVEVPWHVPCGGVCYGDGNLAFIANDWHTALLPVYLKAYYRDHGLMKYTRSILVIHNIAHQGRGPVDDFAVTGLPQHYIDLFKLYDPVGGDHLNIFAAGLKAADRVVTVSHGYAWELKTSEGGWGLHEIINESNWKFHGIVNGIDTREWNPELDVHLKSDGYTNYSLKTLETGKAQCKAALQRELGLAVRADVPVITFIGRLDYQKGLDLIAEAVPWIVGQDVQLVMLGTGRPDLEEILRNFEGQHNDKFRAWVGFSVKMAHRMTAGADILLMPSRFEPCGLNQLYAMMYGTVPVVHAVGGLRDTVAQFDPFREAGLGWTFDRAETNKLINALGHCLNTYRNFKESWKGLQLRGMSQDLSWDIAAQRYEEVLVAAKYQW